MFQTESHGFSTSSVYPHEIPMKSPIFSDIPRVSVTSPWVFIVSNFRCVRRVRLRHGHQAQWHPAAVQIRPATQELRDVSRALGEGTTGGALPGRTVSIKAQVQQGADPFAGELLSS